MKSSSTQFKIEICNFLKKFVKTKVDEKICQIDKHHSKIFISQVKFSTTYFKMKIFIRCLTIFTILSLVMADEKLFIGGTCNSTNVRCEFHINRWSQKRCWQPTRHCKLPMNERCFCETQTRETRWSRCKIKFTCVDEDVTTKDPIWTTTEEISTTEAPKTGGVYLLWWHIALIATGGGIMAILLAALGLFMICKFYVIPKFRGTR